MSIYKSEFLNTLSTRGYIHQCSDAAGLDALAAKGDVTAYIGFDCVSRAKATCYMNKLYPALFDYYSAKAYKENSDFDKQSYPHGGKPDADSKLFKATSGLSGAKSECSATP